MRSPISSTVPATAAIIVTVVWARSTKTVPVSSVVECGPGASAARDLICRPTGAGRGSWSSPSTGPMGASGRLRSRARFLPITSGDANTGRRAVAWRRTVSRRDVDSEAVAKQKEPTRDEALGAAVVTTVMQCRARFIDTGGSTVPVVDYELDLPNGERSGLEISRITDEKLLRLSASTRGLDWSLVKARHSWDLGVAGHASLKGLRTECDNLLAVLDEHDVHVLGDSVLPDGEAREPAQRLLDLGVITATARVDLGTDDRRVRVYPSWPWGSYHPGRELNSRVGSEARANEGKFLGDGNRRGHLFLWADSLALDVATSLSWDAAWRYIDAPPELLVGVAIVWIAPYPFTTEAAGQSVWLHASESDEEPITVIHHVWRVEPPSQWERLGDVTINSTCRP